MTLRSYVRVRVRVRFFLIVRVRVRVFLFPTTKWGDFLNKWRDFLQFFMLNICLSLNIELFQHITFIVWLSKIHFHGNLQLLS